MMKINFVCLLAGVSLVMPVVAFAQSNDAKYCSALSAQYETYAQDNGGKSHNAPPASVGAAMSKCSSDPASAIPVLEGALNQAKVALPPRS
jgi:hypothetical protein